MHHLLFRIWRIRSSTCGFDGRLLAHPSIVLLWRIDACASAGPCQFPTVGTIPDYEAHRLLDPTPVVLFRNDCGRLIDARMLLHMYGPSDLVLLQWIRNDFFISEHQPVIVEQLVLGCRAPKSTLLGPIGSLGIFAVLEVVLDLIESLLADRLIILHSQVAPVDDGVDELIRIGFEVPTSLDTTDSLESERVPDAPRGDIGLIHEIKDRIGVTLSVTLNEPASLRSDIAQEKPPTNQHRSPFQVNLAHQSSHTSISSGVRDKKAPITDMAAPARIIGFDIEAAQAPPTPVLSFTEVGHLRALPKQHDGSEVAKPKGPEVSERDGINHRKGVTLFNLAIELVR